MASETAEAVVEEVVREVEGIGQFSRHIQDSIPEIIHFSIQVVLALVIFFVGRIIIRWVRRIVKMSLKRSQVDRGVEQFVDSMLKIGLHMLLIFMIATRFGVEPTSVAALIASAGLAIGFALQGSLSNFAGGILILLLKPFVVGDYIIVNAPNNEGTVKEIQIFYTKLSTSDNKTIVIPNGLLANTILTNVTEKNERRLDLTLGISYQADIKQVKSLVEDILKADESILKDRDVRVFVDSLETNSVVIGLRAWVKSEEYMQTRWRILEEIKLMIDIHNLKMP